MKKDILIITAMKMELPPVSGAVVTGFGKEKTKKTMLEILETRNPSLVILTGLVGAVVPILKAGDIFVPEKIIDYKDRKTYDIKYSAVRLRSILLREESDALSSPEQAPGYSRAVIKFNIEKKGILVTVPKIFERRDKYRLKEMIPDASCVDMEASGIAEVLEPLGTPFLCIKSVCDELDFDFSDKQLLNENMTTAVKNCNDFLCRILKQIS